MRTLLVLVLMAVALLAHCAADGPSSGSFTPVAAIAYAGDPVPEPPPVCPDTHPLHDGAGATVLRTAASSDLAPAPAVLDLGPVWSSPGAHCALAASPLDVPGGSALCLELCVSRR